MDLNFAAIREHITRAVLHVLAHSEPAPDGWRGRDPEPLAEAIAVHATAAIAPAVDRDIQRITEGTLRELGGPRPGDQKVGSLGPRLDVVLDASGCIVLVGPVHRTTIANADAGNGVLLLARRRANA